MEKVSSGTRCGTSRAGHVKPCLNMGGPSSKLGTNVLPTGEDELRRAQRQIGFFHRLRRMATQFLPLSTLGQQKKESERLLKLLVLTVPRRGAEQSHDSPGKSQVAGQGDSQSDSLGDVSDPWLARLIEVWPALADDVKGEMLTLAGLRPDDVDDFNDVRTDVAPVGERESR